jgi:LPS-assembly protein
VSRRYLTSRDGESDSAITLQLVLKGFGSTGSPAERMLDRGILGYDRFDRY